MSALPLRGKPSPSMVFKPQLNELNERAGSLWSHESDFGHQNSCRLNSEPGCCCAVGLEEEGKRKGSFTPEGGESKSMHI